jgi:hypothetical protein
MRVIQPLLFAKWLLPMLRFLGIRFALILMTGHAVAVQVDQLEVNRSLQVAEVVEVVDGDAVILDRAINDAL